MTALVAMAWSVGLTRTCGVRVSRSPLNAGLTSQRAVSPRETFRISSPVSSSMSQTRSGWHTTTASVRPYGYWTNSSFRMIGACPPAFQAASAAWMSGSSGPTSSAVEDGTSGARSPGASVTSVARTSSPAGAGGGVVAAQPARSPPEPPRTVSVTSARSREVVDMAPGLLQVLRPAKVRHVQPEGIHLHGVLGRRRHHIDGENRFPVRPADEQPVDAPLLLRPAHLPGAVRDPEETRHRRDHGVGLGDL